MIISKLQSLTELSLGLENDINEYSDSVCALKNLSVLRISNTSAEEISDWIGNLQSLNKLKIGRCKNIKTLPESIGNLHSLKYIHLSFNKEFTILPDSIFKLKNLTILEINHSSSAGT